MLYILRVSKTHYLKGEYMDTKTFYAVDKKAAKIYLRIRRKVRGSGSPMWNTFRSLLYSEMDKTENRIDRLAYSKVLNLAVNMINQGAA
jgi:DNA-binding transcriptional regulator PaaX